MEQKIWSAVCRELDRLRETTFDVEEGLLFLECRGKNYHTNFTQGFVHQTRENLNWIPALLKRGREEDRELALSILPRVLEMQDTDPKSPTYGVWPYHFEEPLSEMKNPDWNWAAFLGSILITLLLEFPKEFDAELTEKIRHAVYCAGESILRRNMGVDYTNISLMTSFVLVVAGEILGEERFFEKGADNLRRQLDFVERNGGYAEYNSPTYGLLDVEETGRLIRYAKDEKVREISRKLHNYAWQVLAEHYHPATGQIAPPHARCYEDIQRNNVRTLFTIGTDGHCMLEQEENWEVNLMWPFMTLECPEEFWGCFEEKAEPELVREDFYKGYDPIKNDEVRVLIEKGTPPISSYTYKTPFYCLGTFDHHDMWNQRRPLMAYLTDKKNAPACFRIRCMHDGMDFAGAVMSNVQEKGAAAGCIGFVKDHGDYHYILTPLVDGTITADEFSVEFTCQGDRSTVKLEETSRNCWCFTVNECRINLVLLDAKFGDSIVYTEKIEEENLTGIRVVLVRGKQEKIDFNVLEEAYLSYWMEITEGEEEPCTEAMSYCDDEMCRVELSVDGEKIGEAEVNLKPGTYLPKQENLEKVFKNGGFYYKEI